MKEDNTVLACVGIFFVFVISVAAGAIMNGYVFSVLWGWFIVPLFNAPHMTVANAIGISLTIGMLTQHKNKADDGKKQFGEIAVELITVVFLAPLFVLFLGWIVKLFM